ncbi:MAG TPA: TRAP transporter TatT component family protein [Desulfatiglandales bacterium]
MATESTTKKTLLALAWFTAIVCLPLQGCMQVALRASPSLFPNVAATIFEECDPELAKASIPSNLKLMEGLLKNDPENKQILTTLSMGFAGYSLLFIEPEEPERASAFYLRALEYGIRSLGEKGAPLRNRDGRLEPVRAALKNMDPNDLEALFWATLSWNAWINLNLDKPSALAQLGAAEACLKRVLELDERFFFSGPHILMGASLAARPPLLGGSPEKARIHFEQAMQANHKKFYLAQVYFAKYYAVRVQDKELFARVLAEVIQGNPGELKEVCLINRVMQIRAQELAKRTEDLFF